MDTHSTNFGYLCNNILNFFVNMRNVIFSRLMLAICLLFFSCVTVTKNNFIDGELIKRVNCIYTDICNTYNTFNGNEHTHQSLVDKYCSRSWQDDEKRVVAAEDKHPGEIGCLDYVFWAQGQDWDSISYSNVKVEKVTSSRAIVTLAVHNGEAKMVRLSLIKEHGQWMIDDFFDESTPQGIRKVMREYIKENS